MSALANGSDAIWFYDLPSDTNIMAEQLPIGATSSWTEASGSFEATFHTPGIYRFTRDADGYVSRVDLITVS